MYSYHLQLFCEGIITNMFCTVICLLPVPFLLFERPLIVLVVFFQTRMQRIQPCAEARYKTVGEAFYKMVRQEGILRPIRGMTAVIVGAGPAHALYFSCYEKAKVVLSKTFLGHNNPVAHCKLEFTISRFVRQHMAVRPKSINLNEWQPVTQGVLFLNRYIWRIGYSAT